MASRQLDEEAIFLIARGIADVATRARYLEQICAGDPKLRERVEALLEVHEGADEFLKSARDPGPTLEHVPSQETIGEEIGRYKLRERLGEGGFGVVWAAEQFTPVRRKVALKIVKPGMDSRDVVARFEAERQALALMDHPNIARVFDAGTTPQGRPYFVMELIRGVPITQYCDEHQMTIAERVRLFIDVCRAIQHAHQKGIIHRDIKPSNILVTLHDDSPVPKVIDFGVAKALSQQLTDKTIYTRVHAAVGTLAYMAPEQASLSNQDIDTRADVYGLGTVLYELLTGTTPLDATRLGQAALDEAMRIIREEEPPRASMKLSSLGATATTTAAHRRTDVSSLAKTLRGDLDWIVMKALDKNRSRRYDTANALAADLGRYLNHDPIEARPPSTAYRLRKVAARHRVALSAGAIVALTLILATVFSTSWAVRAQRALEKAQNILFDKVLMYALSGDVELTELALTDADDVQLDDWRKQFALAVAYTWRGRQGDPKRAQELYAQAQEEHGSSYAIEASSLQVIDSDREYYQKVQDLRSSGPAEPFDYIFQVQAEAWYTPSKAIEALERCGDWQNSTLADYFGAVALVNDALVRQDLAGAETAIGMFGKLQKYYPHNKLSLCGLLYTRLAARNIALYGNNAEEAATHEHAAAELVEELAVADPTNVFWATRTRAWYYAECGQGARALEEWKKRMGRDPLGVDPMHYAACCYLFGDRSIRAEAIDALPDAFGQQNGHAHLAKAYLLALTQADVTQLEAACRDLKALNDDRREIQCGVVEVWLARGDLQRARAEARTLNRRPAEEWNRHWDLFLDYVIDEHPDDQAFIEAFEATQPPVFQANAQYLAGLTQYAKGNLEQARSCFQNARNKGFVFANWYWWSKVFLQQ